ncbi:MAG: hypothetical protein J6T22_10575 [Bacteroidales bacterium]|nr:hypothetical protein [Bacteroidales bacterium]
MKEKRSSDTKQFLLTLLATTISIILTFGTSAVIDRRHKEAAKKEMVMMIIYDFDKTIEQVQKLDVAFQKANQTQLEIALHPEYFDSLRYQIMSAIPIITVEFSETTENIFSSNIETFNTLGNVNFVHEVSSFYNNRRTYQEIVVDQFKKELRETTALQSLENLFQVSFPMYCFTSRQFLKSLQRTRNRCLQMMKISEEELKEFSNQRLTSEDKSENNDYNQMLEKLFEEEAIIDQAKEKFGIIE